MARPQKNNADYFSHDADMRNDARVKSLRSKHGLPGYAVWNMILEMLTDKDGFVVKWDELGRELIAGDFGLEVEMLEQIVEYCIRIGLLELTGDVLGCQKLTDRLSCVIEKRERMRKPHSGDNNPPKSELLPQIATEMPQSKVKETKGKESISHIARDRFAERCDTKLTADIERAISIWNNFAKRNTLPTVEITPTRREQIISRFSDPAFDLEKILARAEKSDLLMGKSGGNWRGMNFAWIFSGPKENWMQVLEGNYDNSVSQSFDESAKKFQEMVK